MLLGRVLVVGVLFATGLLISACGDGQISDSGGDPRISSEQSGPGAPGSQLPSGSPPPPAELFPPTMIGEITPSLQKARGANGSSDVCAAPCGVHFDATGTVWSGHSREETDFDLDYRWDFGDPSCSTDGVFEASGKRCSEASGFITGHLYEKPGTYTVTLCVVDGDEGACRSTDVVVSDADAVYPGTQTVCVSTSGDHAGCPAGALQVSSQSDFDAALNTHLGANKRVLFHRGQTFQANDGFLFTGSHRNMLVGAYGAGAKPRIEAAGTVLFINTCSSPGPAPVDTRIVDLEIHNGVNFIQLQDPAKQLTVAQNDLTGTWTHGVLAQIDQWTDAIAHCESGNGHSPAEQWFMVENDHGASTSRNVTMSAERSALLGNTFRGSANSHTVRWQGAERNVISHNAFVGSPGGGLHQLKYHGGLYNDPHFGGVNEYSVVSHNYVVSRNTPWAVTLGQQGLAGTLPASSNERVAKLLVEHNYFKDGDGRAQIFVRVDADQSRFSDNVCEQKVSGDNDIICVAFGLRDPVPLVGHHRAHRNILYDAVSHNSSSKTVAFSIGAENQAQDNIVWAPNGGSDDAVTGLGTCASGACSSNLSTDDLGTSPFVSSDPSSLDDYELR